MRKTILKTLCLGLLGSIGAGMAQAAPVTWMLDATFNDGISATGTFVFDADINQFIEFDITTTSGNSYGFINARSPGNAGLVSTIATENPENGDAQMFLQLTESMTNEGGVIDIVPGFLWSGGTGFSWEGICTSSGCQTSGAYRDVVFGQISSLDSAAVPVPGALPLLAMAMATMGFVRRRRRESKS